MLLAPVLASADLAEQSKEFPPGFFSDGGHYTLADLKGKVVVLVFFEMNYEGNKGHISDWNKLAEQYKDKPIKFLAVASHSDLAKVQAYASETTHKDARLRGQSCAHGRAVGHEDFNGLCSGISDPRTGWERRRT